MKQKFVSILMLAIVMLAFAPSVSAESTTLHLSDGQDYQGQYGDTYVYFNYVEMSEETLRVAIYQGTQEHCVLRVVQTLHVGQSTGWGGTTITNYGKVDVCDWFGLFDCTQNLEVEVTY